MPTFSKRLQKADKRFLDIHFDVVHTADQIKMLVSVYEGGRKSTFFHMQKKEHHWRIVNAPKVADEYLQMEKMLDTAIKDWEQKND